MSELQRLVASLFRMPGHPRTATADLLDRAASAHAVLLAQAAAHDRPAHDPDPARVMELLQRPALAAARQCLLCDPLLIEALHGLASTCPALRRWHESVASPCASNVAAQLFPRAGTDLLGNVLLVLLLRAEPDWCGRIALGTDLVGRLRFPVCDWSVTLVPRGGNRNAIVEHHVNVSLAQRGACWCCGAKRRPFLRMPRDDCLRMLVANDPELDAGRWRFPDDALRPRLQWAAPLAATAVRYDPVFFLDYDAHAGLTGAIAEHVLEALRHNSPFIYEEFRTYMHAIRGFELPPSPKGVLQSFSDPVTPGVMHVNIPYTRDHQPCLCPFCFTWFGHELAHTKNYLIGNIAYHEGWTFVLNSADSTGYLPRYRRALSVRSLFQVPYVHLYEWTLLMDFLSAAFAGLPWDVADDPFAAGDDLHAEIQEAFDLIAACARLTPLGRAAVAHLRNLFEETTARWHAIQLRTRRTTTIPPRPQRGEILSVRESTTTYQDKPQ